MVDNEDVNVTVVQEYHGTNWVKVNLEDSPGCVDGLFRPFGMNKLNLFGFEPFVEGPTEGSVLYELDVIAWRLSNVPVFGPTLWSILCIGCTVVLLPYYFVDFILPLTVILIKFIFPIVEGPERDAFYSFTLESRMILKWRYVVRFVKGINASFWAWYYWITWTNASTRLSRAFFNTVWFLSMYIGGRLYWWFETFVKATKIRRPDVENFIEAKKPWVLKTLAQVKIALLSVTRIESWTYLISGITPANLWHVRWVFFLGSFILTTVNGATESKIILYKLSLLDNPDPTSYDLADLYYAIYRDISATFPSIHKSVEDSYDKFWWIIEDPVDPNAKPDEPWKANYDFSKKIKK